MSFLVIALFFVLNTVSASITFTNVPTLDRSSGSHTATITIISSETEMITFNQPSTITQDGKTITFTQPTDILLTANNPEIIQIQYVVPSGFEFKLGKIYQTSLFAEGTISFQSGQILTFETSSFCNVGNEGNLGVEISDIQATGFSDDDDEWYLLDEIKIEVRIHNNGNDDIENAQVEYAIYTLDGEFMVGEIVDEVDIDEGDYETLQFIFTLDPEDFDSNKEDYALYARATGEIFNGINEGEDTCDSNSQEVQIMFDKDFVILDNIQFNPTSVVASESFNVNALVWNIGENKQDDVVVRVYNGELGIDERIVVGDIDSLESEELGFNLAIPENTIVGNYLFIFEVLDEDNDVYENENDDESRFSVPLEVLEDPDRLEIEYISPLMDSIVTGDFASLTVETDQNAVCSYSLYKIEDAFLNEDYYVGITSVTEMSITGGTIHMGALEGLEEGIRYASIIECRNEKGYRRGETRFTIDLTELREVMILEDIGKYVYNKSIITEFSDEEYGIINLHYAYYNITEERIPAVSITEFENTLLANNWLIESAEVFELTPQNIGGQNVYASNDNQDLQYTTWTNGNFVVTVIVFSLEPEPRPLPLIEAYLEKYPIDIELEDNTSPTIELISPSDGKDYETDEREREIDFYYEVSDDSGIKECRLFTEGDIEETDSSVENGRNSFDNVELDSDDSYYWYVECEDINGNVGKSEEWSFDIDEEEENNDDDNDSRSSRNNHYPIIFEPVLDNIDNNDSINSGEVNQNLILSGSQSPKQAKSYETETAFLFLVSFGLLIILVMLWIVVVVKGKR